MDFPVTSGWTSRTQGKVGIVTDVFSKMSELTEKWTQSDRNNRATNELLKKIRSLEKVQRVQVVDRDNANNAVDLLIVGVGDASIYDVISSLIVDYEIQNKIRVSYTYRRYQDIQKKG